MRKSAGRCNVIVIPANKKPGSWSRDHAQPIRGQNSERCNGIAIFLGQVNTNNLYYLVSKHSPTARKSLTSLTSYCSLYHSGQKQTSSKTPGMETGPRENIQSSKVVQKWKAFLASPQNFLIQLRSPTL